MYLENESVPGTDLKLHLITFIFLNTFIFYVLKDKTSDTLNWITDTNKTYKTNLHNT